MAGDADQDVLNRWRGMANNQKTEQPEAHGHNFCRLIFISRILSQACRMQPSRHASSDCYPIHSAAGKLKPQVVQVAPGVCRFGLRDETPVQKVPALDEIWPRCASIRATFAPSPPP